MSTEYPSRDQIIKACKALNDLGITFANGLMLYALRGESAYRGDAPVPNVDGCTMKIGRVKSLTEPGGGGWECSDPDCPTHAGARRET